MKLLINTIICNNKYPPLYKAFVESLVFATAKDCEDTNIIMLCEAKYNNVIEDSKVNVITLYLHQRLFKKKIYIKRVQAILNKEQPDVVWHVDVDMIGFYTTSCQFLWSRCVQIATKKQNQLPIASTIFTDDEKIQQQVLHAKAIKYWLAPPHQAFKPLTWDCKMQVYETYTDGHAYFHLWAEQLPESSIIACLKAFSTFKQWQKSQMKLVITAKKIALQLYILLQTYKFKQDVLLFPYDSINDLANITTASYATLYCAATDFLGWYTTSCAAAKVLTITTRTISLHENAAFTCVWNHASLSKAMITLYKDEQLQQKINAAQALLLSHLFSFPLEE